MAISAINLGSTFTNLNGTSVVSGLSSGLNTEAVINSLVASQSSQITKLNDQVTVNNTQVTALSSLQQILTQLQNAASQLDNPQSPDGSSNIFANTTTQVTSNTSQAASNYLTATSTAATPAGTYTISDISQLATASNQTTSTTFSSATASVVADTATSGEFTAGTYTITGPSGSGSVTLSDTDNIYDVATDFNNATSSTGISASVLQTSPGVYTLVFASTATGSSTSFDLSNGGSTPTVTNSGGTATSLGDVNFNTAVAGKDASFDLNGVPITRSTNTISDLISGVTINLLQNTLNQTGASFTLQIGPDTSDIETAITNFATAYNNFLTFYAQQTALNSSGTPASSATLYSDNTLRTIYNQLSTQVAAIVTGLSSGSGSSTPNQLSDIGISLVDTPATTTTPAIANTLSVNSTTLDAAINNDLSAVENIFGYNLTSSSSNLVSYQSATDTSISSYIVNVDQTSVPPSYTATYTNSAGTPQVVDLTAASLGTGGIALSAPSTSALAGLILIYAGSGNESNIKVSTTQGIAANINSFLTTALTTNTGLIATDESGIQTKTTSLQTQITNVTTQVANQRAELLQKYADLEAAISSANSSLNLLNAQQAAQTASG